MVYKMNESIIVIQAEAINPIQTNVVFWSHDRGTAKLRMKLVRKNGIPQSLPEGTTVPIRLIFKSATAEGGYGKHDYLATIEDRVNGIVSIILEDNILGYVGKVEGSVYIDFPDDRSLDTAGRFTFDIKRSPIDDSTPELEDYYFNGFSQTIDKIEKILADGKQEIEQKIAESETQIEAKVKDTNDKITKANQKITEYDQNLNELRNDLKLSEAWAWSKDGTDRFTTVYPEENLWVQSSSTSGYINATDGSVTVADSVQKEIVSTFVEINPLLPYWMQYEVDLKIGQYGWFGIGFYDANKVFIDRPAWATKAVTKDETISESQKINVPSNARFARISFRSYGNARTKFEQSDIATIYTPSPSDDYANAYPQYRGLALLPSDLPDDYSWDITPEYTEKGLNNTVSLTEPETILGLKNFAEGLQSSGVNVAVEYAKAIDTDKYTKHGAIYLGGCAWLAWETLTFQKTEGYAKGSYIRLGADGNASFTYSDVPNIFGGYLWLGGVCQPDYTDGGFGSYHITVENNFDDARKPIVRFIDSPPTPVKKLAVRGFALVFAPAPTENSQVKE